jgi:hypothetical protein
MYPYCGRAEASVMDAAAVAAVVELVGLVRVVPRGTPMSLHTRWTRWVGDVRRRRRPAISPVSRRVTRAAATQPTHRAPKDHRRQALRRGGRARRSGPRPDRRALARRPAHPRSAGPQRAGPRPAARLGGGCATARAGAATTSAWTTGPSSNSSHGSRPVRRCPSDPCSASSTDTPAVARGQPPPHADAEPHTPAYAAASCHINCAIELAPRGRPAQRHPTPTRAPQPRRDRDLLQGGEIIETVHARRPPMIPASAGLALPFTG